MKELEFREIKFRAFDTENKTWTFVTLGDLICGACTEKGDKPLSGAKKVWEQYTGLKDRDGKEIYEGDILRLYDRFVSVITWDTAAASFQWFATDGDGYCRLSELDKDYYEIIGNIHENGELLGGKE